MIPVEESVLKVICGYAGSKSKFADRIAQILLRHCPEHVFDLCCATGSVSMALVDVGYPPERITMVDAGPWGMFWSQIGRGTFDLVGFRTLMTHMPADPTKVAAWVEQDVASRPVSSSTFLVLQAASHGATPVWYDGANWRRGEGNRKYKARGFWTPPPGSKEKNPRGTIFRPEELVPRVEEIVEKMRGVEAFHAKAEMIPITDVVSSAVYCDPQYEGITSYGTTIDWRTTLVDRLGFARLFVSEGKPLEGAHATTCLYTRKRGGLNGAGAEEGAEEWLSTWRGAL